MIHDVILHSYFTVNYLKVSEGLMSILSQKKPFEKEGKRHLPIGDENPCCCLNPNREPVIHRNTLKYSLIYCISINFMYFLQ